MNATSLNKRIVRCRGEDTNVLLRDLVDHLDAMVAYWDSNQICRFANHAYQDWFGREGRQLIGISMKELLGPLYEKNLPYIEAALRGEKQIFERAIPRPDGRGVRHSLATYYPHFVDGQVKGLFVHVADVDPLKRLEEELKAAKEKAEILATHDFLTGLPNRRLLHETVADAIARAKRTGETVTLMTIDVDKFKTINDTYGHGEGDRFLIEIASRLARCVREYDAVFRLGGDEFIIVASGLPAGDELEGYARRILEAAREAFSFGNVVINPGLSIGIAMYPLHGRTTLGLMSASDRALYAAKQSGRNCFSIAV